MQVKTTHTTESAVQFSVSPRLVAILGEHLIRDNTVGLMELIKNGYDADAEHVTVEMYDLADPARSMVIVQDNGDGMTRDVLVGPWLTVANGHKESKKERQERSGHGRIPLGEKGVGRFAAHKLGHHLLLITRPRGQETELVLEIAWDDFESGAADIAAVPLRLTERAPRFFVDPDAHGTRLEMTGSREKWTRKDVARLQASLIRLTHPRFGVGDFQVTLRCPEFSDLENLLSDDITEKYQFRLDCLIDEQGMAVYEYRWRDQTLQEQRRSDAVMLWKQRLEREPACGPVTIQLCAWLNRQKTLQELGTSKEQLAVLSGVSIYRDGFRILPYGDEGDDWLGLDARRINVPSVRFGNRQVVGAVGIDQVHNLALVDKTNREGLQENQAYQDLKAMMLEVVNLLEQLSLPERQQQHQNLVERKQRLDEDLKQLDRRVQSLQEAQRAAVAVTTERRPAPQPAPVPTPSPEPGRQQVLVDLAEVEELQRSARAVRQAAAEVADMQDEEREAFLHLVGSGLAAERFVHEMDRQLARALEACEVLRRSDLPTAAKRAATELDLFVNALRGEMRLLGQLKYIRRSQRASDVSVREIVEFLLLSYDGDFTALNVDVDPWVEDDFRVFMSEAAVAQVIDNILNNATYWLGQTEPQEGRKLRIDLDPVARTLTISNNGPAIDPLVRDRLFTRPFATAKAEGHGLGMYLCAEIMKRVGGSLTLLPEDECEWTGPAFVVRFPAEGAGGAEK